MTVIACAKKPAVTGDARKSTMHLKPKKAAGKVTTCSLPLWTCYAYIRS